MSLTVLTHSGLQNEHTIHLVRGSNAASGASVSSSSTAAAGGSDRTSTPVPGPPGSDTRSNDPGATRGSGAAGGVFPGLGMDMNEMQRQVLG